MWPNLFQVAFSFFLVACGYFFHSSLHQSAMKLGKIAEDYVEKLKEEQERELNRLRFNLEISEKVIKERNKSIEQLEKMIRSMEDKVIKEIENEKAMASNLLSDFI